jgi:hypothetical protein
LRLRALDVIERVCARLEGLTASKVEDPLVVVEALREVLTAAEMEAGLDTPRRVVVEPDLPEPFTR